MPKTDKNNNKEKIGHCGERNLVDNSELAGFIIFVTIVLIWHAYRSKTDAEYQKLLMEIRTFEITGEVRPPAGLAPEA